MEYLFNWVHHLNVSVPFTSSTAFFIVLMVSGSLFVVYGYSGVFSRVFGVFCAFVSFFICSPSHVTFYYIVRKQNFSR